MAEEALWRRVVVNKAIDHASAWFSNKLLRIESIVAIKVTANTAPMLRLRITHFTAVLISIYGIRRWTCNSKSEVSLSKLWTEAWTRVEYALS
jgi:hypothetical protein